MNVAQFMTREPVTVSPKTTLLQALAILDDVGVRHLPVVEDGALVGVLSDRDLLEHTGYGLLGSQRGGDVAVEAVMRREPVTAAPDDLIVSAVTELSVHGIGCLPVIEHGRLVGIVSETDFLRILADIAAAGLAPAGLDPEVGTLARSDVATLGPDATLADAYALTWSRGVRHVPIVDPSGAVRGIVSDRDLRRARGASVARETPIMELATTDVLCVRTDQRVSDAARLMADARVSALPVLGSGLVGIVTTTDVLEHALLALS